MPLLGVVLAGTALHVSRDVFYVMQQKNQLAIAIVDRAVDGLPVAFDKPAVGIAYIVALDRHSVRSVGLCNYLQGGIQVADAVSQRIRWIVWKNLEK